MKTSRNRVSGFTLVEVLITLAILGILAAIAYPIYTGYITNAKRSEARTNLAVLRLLIEQYNAENGKSCPAATCAGQSYTYTENADGSIATQTIITNYLTGFKPKVVEYGTTVLYHYTIALTSNTAYTITAIPQTSRGAPPTNLTINQDGVKTGPW
jgi:prepilin-type N-terminal cleavage/methylation domain-containing protein